jgi:hypothetical protein
MANTTRKMRKRMRQSTRVLTREINYFRDRQSAYGHDKKDDARLPGELLAAAVEYIKLADIQLKTRIPFALEQAARERRVNGWGFYSTYGGSGWGVDNTLNIQRPEGLPADLPWQPLDMKRNIYQACAYLLAELQKMEREEIAEEQKFKPGAEIQPEELYPLGTTVGYAGNAQNANTYTINPAVNASPLIFQPGNVQPMPQAISCP